MYRVEWRLCFHVVTAMYMYVSAFFTKLYSVLENKTWREILSDSATCSNLSLKLNNSIKNMCMFCLDCFIHMHALYMHVNEAIKIKHALVHYRVHYSGFCLVLSSWLCLVHLPLEFGFFN